MVHCFEQVAVSAHHFERLPAMTVHDLTDAGAVLQQCRSRVLPREMLLKKLPGSGADRDAASGSGLGRLLLSAPWDRGDGSLNEHGGSFEIDVLPAEATGLASATARPCDDREQGAEVGIVGDSALDQSPH